MDTPIPTLEPWLHARISAFPSTSDISLSCVTQEEEPSQPQDHAGGRHSLESALKPDQNTLLLFHLEDGLQDDRHGGQDGSSKARISSFYPLCSRAHGCGPGMSAGLLAVGEVLSMPVVKCKQP